MAHAEETSQLNFPKKTGSRETIKLPDSEETWLHCEVKPAEMAEFFVEFCVARGVDAQEARQFFNEHVEVIFGTPKLEDSRLSAAWKLLEAATEKITDLMTGNGTLACVTGFRDETVKVYFDVPNVLRFLMKNQMTVEHMSIPGFVQMSTEQKVAAITEILTSMLQHEFEHVLQEMKSSEKLLQAKKAATANNAAFLVGFASIMTLPFITPNVINIVGGAGVVLAAVSAVKFIVEKQVKWVEAEAYEIQG